MLQQLVFLCTAIAYSLYVTAQKGVKAQTAGIISGMETVYGIVFALIFFKRNPYGQRTGRRCSDTWNRIFIRPCIAKINHKEIF